MPKANEAQDELDEEEKYKKYLKQDMYDDSNDILTDLKNEPVEVLPEIQIETTEPVNESFDPINLADFNISMPKMPSEQE